MSETGSVKGFIDFDDLVKRNLKGYSARLENLFNVCCENRDVRHTIPFEEAVSRLISGCQSALTALEIEGNVIKEFVIGKSFVMQKTGVRFRPDKRTTWTLGGGINGRWREYNDKGYDGLVVLGCIEKELIPMDVREKVKFDYNDGDHEKRKQRFEVDQQLYALALEQRLIQHFIFNEKDHRIRNHSLDCGMKTKTPYRGGIVYLAYRLQNIQSEETSMEDETEYGPSQHNNEIHEYVVSLDNKNQLITMSSFERSRFKETVRSRFGLPVNKDLEIQCYKFDTWAKVSEQDVPKNGKVKVILKQNQPKAFKKTVPKPSTISQKNFILSGDSETKQKVTFADQTCRSSPTYENSFPEQSTSRMTTPQQLKIVDLENGFVSKIIRVVVLESTTKDFHRVLKDNTGKIGVSCCSSQLEQYLVPGKVYAISKFDVINSDNRKEVVLGRNTIAQEVEAGVKRKIQINQNESSPSKQSIPQQQKVVAPKKSKEEKKIILQEVLRNSTHVKPTSEYKAIVDSVISKRDAFPPTIKEYYNKMLENDKGKETLRKRILTTIRADPEDLLKAEKDSEIRTLLHDILLKYRK